MTPLITRRLGRTERQVTTMGLGGQASIQWTGKGIDPIAIIEKAYRIGINYMDTSNVYGPSQKNYGEAFRGLGLSPAAANYDPAARKKIFLATKTHFRSARQPNGDRFRTDFSDGMTDGFNVASSVDDVRRSLSLMFGDGKGGYPEGAYLDSIQFHNLNTQEEVDMLFEGSDDPNPHREWMGSLAAMLDLREGTNRTGLNPEKEKLVRHIGITGHWNTAAHMYAIRQDRKRILDTLLVTVNPSDGKYLAHRYNAIETARAADMGIIGMKVFADAAYYHKEPRFSNSPEDVYLGVGSEDLPSRDLIQYALSFQGISTLILGIGHVDDHPEKCQMEQNLRAAQIETPLNAQAMKAIEDRVTSLGKDKANAYFQQRAMGLTAPRNVGVEEDSPMPRMGRKAVRISWDTAYAGTAPIERYEVLRNQEVIGSVPHVPQIREKRFAYEDVPGTDDNLGDFHYSVRSVDAAGSTARSSSMGPLGTLSKT
ncbi:MAG: aldo/keto reductase [Desulfobacteraceae bacterium]|nr:aldo/keto reductase [Desulfobacteraceae bacterium]MBU4053867.1 aldo/keto reductase [Pseudomonadota bacterium]